MAGMVQVARAARSPSAGGLAHMFLDERQRRSVPLRNGLGHNVEHD